MISHRMLIHVATDILIKTYFHWDDSMSDGICLDQRFNQNILVTLYCIPSGYVDHRFSTDIRYSGSLRLLIHVHFSFTDTL